MRNRTKRAKTSSFDKFAIVLMASLIGDFRSNLGDPEFCSDIVAAVQRNDIIGIREVMAKEIQETDAYRFKCRYQVLSLFKRYRFRHDLWTDAELEEQAIAKFIDVQRHIAGIRWDELDALTNHILAVAQSYAARILGSFSSDEHRPLCRFGKRASVGIPGRVACEGARWELPITGSQEQIDWFREEIHGSGLEEDYVLSQQASPVFAGRTYQSVSCLSLTLVPKSFKSLRAIMPNTTIGSYISYGHGSIIASRLRRAGFNINKLQLIHRELARKSSVTHLNVTMDLSSASDTLSTELVRRILPEDWFNELNRFRIRDVRLPNGAIIQSETFCTMGIGYTFPLETLIFLCLLFAIRKCLHWHGRKTVSVYGDDMIFHRDMHESVCMVFEKIGLLVNHDKTFAEGDFRESCGGDYFRGVDVRPFQPQNGCFDLTPMEYEASLYKWTNGLLRRWDQSEIPLTLDAISTQFRIRHTVPKCVPIDFPDDGGIQLRDVRDSEFRNVLGLPRLKSVGHGVFQFTYLRFRSDLRAEDRHIPYYILSLRQLDGASEWVYYDPLKCHDINGHISMAQKKILGLDKDRAPLLLYVEAKRIRGLPRAKGRVTAIGIPMSGRYTRQRGTSCF